MTKPLPKLDEDLLRDLADCQKGKGLPTTRFDAALKKAARNLMRRGFAWSLGTGVLDVLLITDEGRLFVATLPDDGFASPAQSA